MATDRDKNRPPNPRPSNPKRKRTSPKRAIGLWVINPETNQPELLEQLSVRASRARKYMKQYGRKYGRRPFLARFDGSGNMGDRIPAEDIRPVRLVGHAGGRVVVGAALAPDSGHWSVQAED